MDIRVLNESFDLVGIIDVFHSLIWTDRYNSFGDFELVTQVTPEILDLLEHDRYLRINQSDRTMIIDTIQIKTDVEQGNRLIISGRSLENLLYRRVVWYQTIFSATNIQYAISELMHDAFITPEGTLGDTLRKVPNMIMIMNFGDPNITGPTVNAQFEGDYIYDAVEGICKQENVGFRMMLNLTTKQFEFGLYSGTDRSYSQNTYPYVVFSPKFDNLISSDYFLSNRYDKVWILTLGYVYPDGQLYRVIVNDPDYQSKPGIKLREGYLDATYVSFFDANTGLPLDTPTFDSHVRREAGLYLKKLSTIESFQGQADTSKGYVYLTDYGLGDIVQIENEYGHKGRARVTEVTISENESGLFVFPTFDVV